MSDTETRARRNELYKADFYAWTQEQARLLRERGAGALRRRLDEEIGKQRSVLVESRDVGRTEQFLPIRLAKHAEPGQIRDLRVAGHTEMQLLAA